MFVSLEALRAKLLSEFSCFLPTSTEFVGKKKQSDICFWICDPWHLEPARFRWSLQTKIYLTCKSLCPTFGHHPRHAPLSRIQYHAYRTTPTLTMASWIPAAMHFWGNDATVAKKVPPTSAVLRSMLSNCMWHTNFGLPSDRQRPLRQHGMFCQLAFCSSN